MERVVERADAQRQRKDLHLILLAGQQVDFLQPADGGVHARVVGGAVALDIGFFVLGEDFAARWSWNRSKQVERELMLDQVVVGVAREGERIEPQGVDHRQGKQPQPWSDRGQVWPVEVDEVVAEHEAPSDAVVAAYRRKLADVAAFQRGRASGIIPADGQRIAVSRAREALARPGGYCIRELQQTGFDLGSGCRGRRFGRRQTDQAQTHVIGAGAWDEMAADDTACEVAGKIPGAAAHDTPGIARCHRVAGPVILIEAPFANIAGEVEYAVGRLVNRIRSDRRRSTQPIFARVRAGFDPLAAPRILVACSATGRGLLPLPFGRQPHLVTQSRARPAAVSDRVVP